MSYKNNKAWRKKHNSIWQKQKTRYYRRFEEEAFNNRQRYTIQEDDMIANKKYPDRIIAAKIGRSVKGIQVRRLRLNKIK